MVEQNVTTAQFYNQKTEWDTFASHAVLQAKSQNACRNSREFEKQKRKKDIKFINKWADFRVKRAKIIKEYYAARKKILMMTKLAKLITCNSCLKKV